MKKAYLILESGEMYPGLWHGGLPKVGEVVFNTSHSGYEEIATDPSYHNQIVVMTSPMQGNYGIHIDDRESEKIHIQGFICQQIQNSTRDSSWSQWLMANKVPVVSEMDTRRIVKRLRNLGTPWGVLLSEDELPLASQYLNNKKPSYGDWVNEMSTKRMYSFKGEKPHGPKIAVIDFGTKKNILRELLQRSSEVLVFPSRTSIEEVVKTQPDGVILTNGPGDPSLVEKAPGEIKKILGKIPIFGICMGHQVLSLALGAKTYKLQFGHRGSNHPIQDLILNKIYMTSQNHGYAVAAESLPQDIKVTHRNLNDNTVAGIFSEQLKILSVQFHPESRPGPHDSVELFDFFINKMV